MLVLEFLDLLFVLGFSVVSYINELLQGIDFFYDLLRTEVGLTAARRDCIAGSLKGSVRVGRLVHSLAVGFVPCRVLRGVHPCFAAKGCKFTV